MKEKLIAGSVAMGLSLSTQLRKPVFLGGFRYFSRICFLLATGIIWFTLMAAKGGIAVSGNIQWDGNVAQYLDGSTATPAPFYAEGNLAQRPGVTAIAKDVLPGYSAHAINHLNDGAYGNGNSWIGNSTNSWAGLDLGFSTQLTAFAFGRDNTSGGVTDRTSGTYTIQYTQSPSPVGAGSSWNTIGAITNIGSDLSLSRRHQFTLSPPVAATGFRIIPPSGACIDEIELYNTTPAALSPPWLTGGHFGQALSMGIDAPHWGEARLDPSYQQRPLTVEAWVKLNSMVATNIIVAAGFMQFAGCWVLASDVNTGNLIAYLPGSSPTTVNTGQNIVDGQWHYVAMVLQATRVQLYVDGVQRANTTLSSFSLPAAGAAPTNNPGSLYFGAYPPNHQGCDGLLDEVRISSQVLSIAGTPTATFQAGSATIGLWHFDQFTNGAFSDSSAEANPVTLAPPPANPVLKLQRGVTFDRLYFGIQSQPMFTPSDVNAIAAMGFDHIKILIDPATHISGAGINPATMPTLKMNVDLALSTGLPVVVDIHPQAGFKTNYLGDPTNFNTYLCFMNAFAGWLATNYTPNQIAFEFMTEPFGNYTDWTAMQYRIWAAVRMAMPNHTLILSGDQTGWYYGLLKVHPVNDSNVLYCFTTYDPFNFTFQGGSFAGVPIQYLQDVPYPSSPAIINAALTNIVTNVPSASQATALQSLLNYGEQAWNAGVLNARFNRLKNWNNFFGGQLQLWAAEFGCLGPDKGGINSLNRYAFVSDLRKAFETNGIWWAYWSYNETFTVLLPYARIPLASTPSSASWTDDLMLNSLGLIALGVNLVANGSFEVNPLGTWTARQLNNPTNLIDATTIYGWRVYDVDPNAAISFQATVIKNASAGGSALRLDVNNQDSGTGYALDQFLSGPWLRYGSNVVLSFDAAYIAGYTNGNNLTVVISEYNSSSTFLGQTVRSYLLTNLNYTSFAQAWTPKYTNTTLVAFAFVPMYGTSGSVSVSIDNVQLQVPVSATSKLTINPVINPVIAVTGTVGMHYQVQYAAALESNTWLLLQDIPALPSSPFKVIDPTQATLLQRFYRTVVAVP